MGRRTNVRWKRALLLTAGGSLLALLALAGVAYALTDVPKPNESATATATRILFSDRSEMGRVGQQNRIPVPLSEVPEDVQRAVLSAEDRGHYTNPGINPRGIGRALFANVRGGGVEQGGSSITQQYAKNAFLTQDRTFSRKLKEVFIALKMSRTVDKDKVLEDYLNTIYFGRQASGIEVAAQTYFGRPARNLSLAQGAVLAASIKSPASLDPEKHPEQAQRRWAYVLDGMVSQGWITAEQRAAQVYPPVKKIGEGNRNNDLSGPKGYVIQAVLAELGKQGFAEDRLNAGGLVVTTTIRKPAQQAAIEAVQEVTGSAPGDDDLQGALVSIKPNTGEVFAYYGGASGTGFDFANQGDGRQPGSSFKPYVLATALEQGISLRTRLDGNSPKEFPGRTEPVANFGGKDYGRVDLVEATQRSINTAYFELGLEVGPSKVAELAHKAGIPDRAPLADPDGSTNGGIALGAYEVRVIDQAVGFATFANLGVPVQPFLVKKVQDSSGEDLYNAEIRTGDRAFSEDVAADATFAMQAVVERGTARGAQLKGGRPAAGKTGTSQDNKDAWFVGYTPQLSTAVWLGYAQPRTITIDGVEATGGGFSSKIWKSYTDVALEGQPTEQFPPRADVGRSTSVDSGSGSDRETKAPRPRRSRTPRTSEPDTSQQTAEPEQTDAPPPSQAPPPPPPSQAPPPRRRRRPRPQRSRPPGPRPPGARPRGEGGRVPRVSTPSLDLTLSPSSGPDRPGGLVLPSQDDPVVAGTANAIGGPPGRHALLGERRFWTPLRWLVLLTLVTSLFGWWQKSPCRVHAWEDQYQYTRGCYTDVFALYFAERLNEGKRPYLDHPVEYPVVIGAVMQVAAKTVTVFPPDQRPRRFYDVTWAILTASALVVVVTTARLAGRRRPWDAALFALSPLLVLHGTTNWDLVAMALAGLGLVQWARRRPLAAGLLLGLATATKLYPVLFLVPLLALCLRARQLRPFAVTAVAMLLTPVLISLPVYLTSPSFAEIGGSQTPVAASPLDRLGDQGLRALAPKIRTVAPDGTQVVGVNAAYRFFQLNTTRPADWDAGWRILEKVVGPLDEGLAPGEPPHNLNRGVALSFALCLLLIVLLALKAPRRPRVMQLLFLTIFAFLLTNKVWSPQFSIWLVPLALLARPRWRPLLAWQAAEAMVLFTRFYFFVRLADEGGSKGISDSWYIAALGLRNLALLVLVGFVVRDILVPDKDVVRAEGVDDPAGGVLDGAPDRDASWVGRRLKVSARA